jgi:hypothetical protein
MGIRTRRVPPGWEHPKDAEGAFVPLCDGTRFDQDVAEWDKSAALWEQGLADYGDGPVQVEAEYRHLTLAEFDGPRPVPEEYTPRWTPEEATHYQRYENVSEGTPTSPVFETVEAMLEWEREQVKKGAPFYYDD